MIPLCVDLDRTLIGTDLLWESLWAGIEHNPRILFAIPFWYLRGKLHLQQRAAEYGSLEIENLPYREPFVGYLRQQHAANRRLFLVTDCSAPLGPLVAEHLGIFEATLVAKQKLEFLTERFGSGNFEYAADPATTGPSLPRTLLRQLRVHQWAKNLLLFGALLLSHNWTNWPKLAACIQGFIAFNLIASSVYVLNDLLDLQADRRHPVKRNRPFASGALPLSWGIVLAPVLAIGGMIVASALGPAFLTMTAAYLAVTAFYSFHGKRKVILDVMLLSALYSIRLYAGGFAAHIPISTWTAAYTGFVFLSLALLKRYVELLGESSGSNRRGYQRDDASIVAALGCASGLIAALPLALYSGSPEVRALYRVPQLLLLLCGVHTYWVSRIWVFAHRGLVQDDPVLFAIRDKATYYLAGCAAVVLYLAI